MSSSTFTILLGGALHPTERLRAAVSGSRFIAADGGMRHATTLGVTPELWVGDFDSSPAELREAFGSVERQPYPAAKAQTDGEIAVEEAIRRGARRIILVGALGGERFDHGLALLLYGVSLAEAGRSVLLTSGEEEAVPLVPGAIELDLPAGSLFSISGFDALYGLNIENARYPLTDFHLPFGASRTISNVAEGPIRLSLSQGRGIVLARPYDLSGV
jgi:thiamine pyrophosphokinase